MFLVLPTAADGDYAARRSSGGKPSRLQDLWDHWGES